MLKHIELSKLTPMTEIQFSEWLLLFTQTTDELFEGKKLMKRKQERQILPDWCCIKFKRYLQNKFWLVVRKQIKRTFRISKYVVYKETLVDLKEKFWSFLGSFLGIGLIAFIQSVYLSENDNLFLIGSFGASSVLIYGVIQSPLAQPRNLIGGHIVSAIIGVTVFQLLPNIVWLTASLAVSLSIIAMQYTKLCTHRRCDSFDCSYRFWKIKALGYLYVIFPVLTGVIILLLIALIINNMTSQRKYPNDGRFSRNFKWIIDPVRQQSQK